MVIYALASLVGEEEGMPVEKVPVTERAPDTKQRAINNCWGAIERTATNPSSINFHSFTAPPNVEVMTDGRIQVFVKFTAKNAYGVDADRKLTS